MTKKAEEASTEEVNVHQTSISMVKVPLAEVTAAADIALKVRLSCPSPCDLRGNKIRVMNQEAVLADGIEVSEFDGSASETGEFVVKAPKEPGACTWTAVFPAQEKEDVLHEECSVPFTFVVKSHTTSMAVWDIPFPIVPGAKFKLKVGARCSVGCNLAGKEVELHNPEGAIVATGALSDAPYSDKVALHWAEIELQAPDKEGYHALTAEFPKPELELPHEGASHNFGFPTVKPSEHAVTVEVMDKETNTPIEDAEVYFGSSGPPYRDRTDERGMVTVELPKGQYELVVSVSEKMPKGVQYRYLEEPFTTRGGEYKHYVPEVNRDSMWDFRTPVGVDRDMVIKVELVGAIEPFQVDTDHLL
jgi:hypothetical protein